MSVVIEEINVRVESGLHEGGGGGEAHSAQSEQKQSIIDLLDLTQERKARLVVD